MSAPAAVPNVEPVPGPGVPEVPGGAVGPPPHEMPGQPPMAPAPPQMGAGQSGVGASGGASGGPHDTSQPFHSASLYVGDLAPDVSEGLLFEIFNAVGSVASIRICRDAVTRRSLGYAYVNFHNVADAERALDTMNYTMIKGRPCRIMWSQRDPSLRRSGVGNIFVKNLHESIDNKQLYDTFSLFGNILSCKVVTDRETGKSKGYGYVHYETAEAARAAIEKLDGMLIDGQEVQVGAFMRRNERPGQTDWTNCFVKSVPLEWDDAKLADVFSEFGEVVSAHIMKGIPKPFAGKRRPMKKLDGEDEAKEDEGAEGENTDGEGAGTDEAKEGEEKHEGDDLEDEEQDNEGAKLTAEDSEIEAAIENNMNANPSEYPSEGGPQKEQSLGFGFVSFKEHESAVAAVEALNGKEFVTMVDGEEYLQEIFVGRAQKKAERERELRAKFEQQKMDRISKFQGVNLYVKNLDDTVTDDILRDEFSAMGTITSARVMKDMKDGRSRGFGFVCYSTPEEATRAVNEMNGKLVAGKPIFVALAQRREVRRAQLEAQHAGRGHGGPQHGPGVGQGPMMRGPMGGMGYPGGTPNMPVYVQRPGPGGGMQPAYPMIPPMMGGPGGRGGGGPQQARPGYQMMAQARGGYPMPPYGVLPQQGQQGRGAMGGGRGAMGPNGPGGRMGRGGGGGRGPPMAAHPMGGRGTPPHGGNGGHPAMHQGRGGQQIKFNQQARNAGAAGPMGGPPQQVPASGPPMAPGGPQGPSPPVAQGPPAPQPQAVPQQAAAPAPAGGPPPSESLTASALASASPEMQKNMIGERLYPLIHQSQPELAGKITGMLLEMDNSELLHLLESPEALNAKITEALQVLEAHNSSGQ